MMTAGGAMTLAAGAGQSIANRHRKHIDYLLEAVVCLRTERLRALPWQRWVWATIMSLFIMKGDRRCWKRTQPMNFCARSRSEEHTSELQSLMRISYAAFCWKKKNT